MYNPPKMQYNKKKYRIAIGVLPHEICSHRSGIEYHSSGGLRGNERRVSCPVYTKVHCRARRLSSGRHDDAGGNPADLYHLTALQDAAERVYPLHHAGVFHRTAAEHPQHAGGNRPDLCGNRIFCGCSHRSGGGVSGLLRRAAGASRGKRTAVRHRRRKHRNSHLCPRWNWRH